MVRAAVELLLLWQRRLCAARQAQQQQGVHSHVRCQSRAVLLHQPWLLLSTTLQAGRTSDVLCASLHAPAAPSVFNFTSTVNMLFYCRSLTRL
jgi:hypothetical protein